LTGSWPGFFLASTVVSGVVIIFRCSGEGTHV